MTIGIAAYGPNAGRAVLDGLLGTETLGRGAIGGFAVVSVIDRAGVHRQMCCQTGGTSGLAGLEAFHDARCAALISSGPNRPEPLSQFLAGQDGVGLVTGHRLPQRPGVSGLPLNAAALAQIAKGADPEAAIRAETEANPEADFGLVAVTADGRIGFGNAARVRRRGDLVHAARTEPDRGYALLANSIHFNQGLRPGDAIGGLIWARLTGTPGAHTLARLSRPVPVEPAAEDRVELDADGYVLRIARADPWWPGTPGTVTVIYSNAPVWQGGRPLGRCATEVFARLDGGMALPDPAQHSSFVVERT